MWSMNATVGESNRQVELFLTIQCYGTTCTSFLVSGHLKQIRGFFKTVIADFLDEAKIILDIQHTVQILKSPLVVMLNLNIIIHIRITETETDSILPQMITLYIVAYWLYRMVCM